MTEDELKLELTCYKEYINNKCDIDNMTKEQMVEFYDLYIKSEKYYSSIKDGLKTKYKD